MNALTLAPVRVPDDSIANLTAPNLAWPNNVPSTETSITLMYDTGRLPAVLRLPTLELLTAFSERNLAMPPDGFGVEEWLKALGITWRLKAASVLARSAKAHDEKGLQTMFDEAAEVREWLLKLANEPGFPSQLEAQALRGLLQAAWGEVLDSAPSPPQAAAQRPQARTGKTGLHRQGLTTSRSKPAPRPAAKPKFEAAGGVYKFKRAFLFLSLAGLIAIRVFFVEGDLKVPTESAPPQAAAHSDAP